MTKTFKAGRGYTKGDWDAVDSPELTDEELATAKPFAEVFPDLAESIRRRGPAKRKEAVSIRLDIDLLERLRATGNGWQSRVNDVLRKHVKEV